jgi:hypothetical protein
MSADITYAIDAEEDQTIFSANSPAGEEFLGDTQLAVPNEEAKVYIGQASAAGLTIIPFP